MLITVGLDPVILNRLPNKGRTVIEKIKANADVGFAVVLLTPGDCGSLLNAKLEPRARQNVLLELGYFLGKLGRERVCALVKGAVEIPSDWRGVISEEYDDLKPHWRLVVVRELKAAGYEIDVNKVV